MTKAKIKSAVETKRGNTGYIVWHIGLTHNLAERKKYWGETERVNVNLWSEWQADSLSDAQDIESYFVKKGMKGTTGENLSPSKMTYVYVF